jgi:DNA (cytosine-5)-methyltransferase 1
MSIAYYNENNLFAAEWLRNLISAGHIAPGDVDTRSIEDVKPDDLKPYTQCHFFAGVGVWSYALRLAGWPDDRRVWTASCPCQPFSTAGAGAGFDDERHLWPALHWLIMHSDVDILFGEQVASKDAEPWVDLVQADLEAMGYEFGCVPFPSAGVGAPHIRDRLYWMADSGLPQRQSQSNVRSAGLFREAVQQKEPGDLSRDMVATPNAAPAGGPVNGFWRDADWIFCRDGRWRPVEPGTFPLVNGAPARVGRLRAYGNAINAEAAKVFIECAIDALVITP